MSVELHEAAHSAVRPPQTAIADRRRAPRLRCLLSGMIVHDDGTSTMDCLVRNISAWGARIAVGDAFRLPEDFNLVVPHHAQTHRARIIWRKGDAAGLALADVAEDASPHGSGGRTAHA
jgi:hypothetical protein